MKCARCGHSLSTKYDSCLRCGASISKTKQPSGKAQQAAGTARTSPPAPRQQPESIPTTVPVGQSTWKVPRHPNTPQKNRPERGSKPAPPKPQPKPKSQPKSKPRPEPQPHKSAASNTSAHKAKENENKPRRPKATPIPTKEASISQGDSYKAVIAWTLAITVFMIFALINNSNDKPVQKQEKLSQSQQQSKSKSDGEPWFVLIATFSSFENANRLLTHLIGSGFSVHITSESEESDTLYRVRMGPYTAIDKAEAASRSVQIEVRDMQPQIFRDKSDRIYKWTEDGVTSFNSALPPNPENKIFEAMRLPDYGAYGLTIEPDPPDAMVRILNIGPKYQSGIKLKPGSYHVEVSKPGYATKTQWVQITDHHVTEQIALHAERFGLTIKTEPQDARVRIMNIRSSYQQGMLLEPGNYLVEVSKPGYEIREQWIELSKSSLQVEIQLPQIASTPEFRNSKDKLSYAVGWDIGSDLLKRGGEFDSSAVIRAILDVDIGKPPDYSEASMNEAIAQLQKSVQTNSNLILSTSEKLKFGYAVGWDIGIDIQKRGQEFGVMAVVSGIEDAIAGKNSRVAMEEMLSLLEELQVKVRNEQASTFQGLALENQKKAEVFFAVNQTKRGIVTLPSGLQYRVIEKGRGRRPSARSTVLLHYRGSKIDGHEFDSSFARGVPEQFNVNSVLKSWQEVLPRMKTGSTWQVFSPPELAFGDRGNPPVGPNEALVFYIKLIKIVK